MREREWVHTSQSYPPPILSIKFRKLDSLSRLQPTLAHPISLQLLHAAQKRRLTSSYYPTPPLPQSYETTQHPSSAPLPRTQARELTVYINLLLLLLFASLL